VSNFSSQSEPFKGGKLKTKLRFELFKLLPVSLLIQRSVDYIAHNIACDVQQIIKLPWIPHILEAFKRFTTQKNKLYSQLEFDYKADTIHRWMNILTPLHQSSNAIICYYFQLERWNECNDNVTAMTMWLQWQCDCNDNVTRRCQMTVQNDFSCYMLCGLCFKGSKTLISL
jgi:hypothetical protein